MCDRAQLLIGFLEIWTRVFILAQKYCTPIFNFWDKLHLDTTTNLLISVRHRKIQLCASILLTKVRNWDYLFQIILNLYSKLYLITWCNVEDEWTGKCDMWVPSSDCGPPDPCVEIGSQRKHAQGEYSHNSGSVCVCVCTGGAFSVTLKIMCAHICVLFISYLRISHKAFLSYSLLLNSPQIHRPLLYLPVFFWITNETNKTPSLICTAHKLLYMCSPPECG